MRQRWRSPTGRARAALLWGLILFALGQLILALCVYRGHSDLCDAGYSSRLRRLRARLAEGRDRPLLLVLGSSRPALGFHPSLTGVHGQPGAPAPIVFNFAFVGSGPVREWMMLRRLLAAGVRPDWLLVEVWAPFMTQIGMYGEQEPVLRADWDWVDLPLLRRFYQLGWAATSSVLERHLAPAVHYRQGLLNRYAPFLLPGELVREMEVLKVRSFVSEDDWGAYPAEGQPMRGEIGEKMLALGRFVLTPVFRDFHIHKNSNEALHALLDECRNRKIKVALFMMPEHSTLRAFYPPTVKAMFHRFVAGLSKEYGIPVIDGRTWCADDEFVDMCHLLGTGARTFSERFGREVCQPLLDGRPLAEEILFQDEQSPQPQQGLSPR